MFASTIVSLGRHRLLESCRISVSRQRAAINIRKHSGPLQRIGLIVRDVKSEVIFSTYISMSNQHRRIVVTGANGMIGRRLVKRLLESGDEVHAFVRDLEKSRASVPADAKLVHWSHDSTSNEWRSSIDGAHAIVNLAGASIGERWTTEHKRRIRDSRILGTRHIVDAIAEASNPPAVLVNASAVGYYGSHVAGKITEDSPAGDDFLAGVCRDWEAEANKARDLGVRVVAVRSGVVLEAHEGPLPRLLLPFRMFVGGPIGSGRQPFPWIHIDDVVEVYRWALNTPEVKGAVNATAPDVMTNGGFARVVGEVMHRPAFFPAPEFAIKLVLGEMADIVTGGQWVVSKRLQDMGYHFRHPRAKEALEALLGED